MPLYEYTCNKCGRDFTALILKSNEKPTCPTHGCRSEEVTKKLSVFSCTTSNVASGSSFGGGGG